MLAQLLAISPEWSAVFLLTFVRISAAIAPMPVFGARGVPSQTKIALALLLSLIVLPLTAEPANGVSTNLLVFASLVGSEILVGLSIGIAVMLVFQGLEMGATLVGIQMGFAIAEVFDPLTGGRVATVDQFYRIVATLVFFAVNGHYLVIQSLLHTFDVVPAGTADLTLIAGDRVVPFFTTLFVVAIRVSLPVVAALVLTDLALALVGRTVPQMNILVVGFPVKIGVGLLVMAASMPLMTAFMASVFGQMLLDVNGFLVP
jgi:flagellar biosynthetic protein FliR